MAVAAISETTGLSADSVLMFYALLYAICVILFRFRLFGFSLLVLLMLQITFKFLFTSLIYILLFIISCRIAIKSWQMLDKFDI